MAQLGKLTVELEANMAKFQSEMSKSARITEQAMNQIKTAADVAKSALAGLAVGAIGALSVSMFKDMIKGAIDAADTISKMSQKTGVAVEALNGLAYSAKLSDVSLGDLGTSSAKLNKALSDAAGGSKEMKVAFTAIGVSVKDAEGKVKTADKAVLELADKFASYEDGPEKAALAIRIFGEAGTKMIPLLNQGSAAIREQMETAQKYGGITTEVAQQAEKFNDTFTKMDLISSAFSRNIAADLLPPMQALADKLLEVKERGDAFEKTAERVANVLVLLAKGAVIGGFGVLDLVDTVTAGTEKLKALATFDFEGAKKIQDSLNETRKASKEAKAALMDALNTKSNPETALRNQEDARDAAMNSILGGAPKKKRAPVLPTAGASAANSDDPARKQRDLALKQIENALAAERDAIKFHDDYISELRRQDVIDYKTYEAEMKSSRDAGLGAAIAAYDKEIAVAKDHQAKTSNRKEKADDDIKIEQARAKKAKAIQDAGQGEVMATLKQTAAQSELKKVMEDWNRQQSQSLDQMQQDVDMMGMSQVEIAKLVAARRILLDVEEQIRRAKEKGTVSDSDVENYRKQAADAIARSNAVYTAGDTKAKDPWFNMSESVRRYGEDAANVGQQIGDAMTNAFKSAEDALVTFSTTGKLSFGDLARSIIADLIRIQSKAQISGLTKYLGDAAMAYFGGGDNSSRTAEMGRITAQASASGGYDIPAGVNPVTQLHEQEMVLPKQHADVIRGLAVGGTSGGLTVNVTNNANAQVETRPSADGSGLDIFINAIKNSIGEDIAYGTGPVNGAIQSRYGLRAAL